MKENPAYREMLKALWPPGIKRKPPDQAPERVVYLTLTTWTESSCVTCAEHWYGKLRQRLKDQSEISYGVDYKLTRADAKRLNKGDLTAPPYRVGERSERFFSRDAVIKAALARWQEYWPEADILILGWPDTSDPQEVLAGPEPLMSEINKIVHLCHTSGYYHVMQHTDEHEVLRRRWLDIWEGVNSGIKKGSK